jgi:hypothetical protein
MWRLSAHVDGLLIVSVAHFGMARDSLHFVMIYIVVLSLNANEKYRYAFLLGSSHARVLFLS